MKADRAARPGSQVTPLRSSLRFSLSICDVVKSEQIVEWEVHLALQGAPNRDRVNACPVRIAEHRFFTAEA